MNDSGQIFHAADRSGLPVLPNSGKVDRLKEDLTEHSASSLLPAIAPSGGPEGEHPLHRSPATFTPAQRSLEAMVIEVLRTIYDPEIPVNIYELGLIYEIDIDSANHVKVKMTLTSPGCPVAGSLPGEVERKIEAIPDVTDTDVELVWEPAWDKSRMSEVAALELGLY